MLPLRMMIRMSPNVGATAFRLNTAGSSCSSFRYTNGLFSALSASRLHLSANVPTNNYVRNNSIVPLCKLATERFYTKEAKQSSTSTAATPPPATPQPPTPTRDKNPINTSMIDKARLEKIFFRVLAFVWDTTIWVFTGLKNFYQHNIMASPTVQMQLKKLVEKMEKAKRDW